MVPPVPAAAAPGWLSRRPGAAALLFACAYTLAPLFYSNQNQYFIHGFAAAGWGQLGGDWLANTADPTPLFSRLIELAVRLLPLEALQLLQFLLLALYARTLFAVGAQLFGAASLDWLIPLLTLLHSAAARAASYRLLGQDYPWYFQAGVAGQYVTGSMIQPSVFGILLLAAIREALREHWLRTSLLVALAATVHPTYLLGGALLTLGVLAHLALRRRWRDLITVAALTLLGVLPVLIDSARRFAPSSAAEFAEAQAILVNVRIPHHCRVDLWLDPVAALQLLWLFSAVALALRTPLGAILGVPVLLAALLTLIQATFPSDTLALLFPWRFSAVAVPLATCLLLGRLSRWLAARVPLRRGGLLAVLALAIAGVGLSVARVGYQMAPEELPLLAHVREQARAGDLYLLPLKIPPLARTTRGSLSSDFKPLPGKRQDGRVIPVEMQRFRLGAAAPLFVDFKSIPYRDADVLEWHRRVRLCESVDAALRAGDLDRVASLIAPEGVTHLVAPAGVELPAGEARFGVEYRDATYQLWRLR